MPIDTRSKRASSVGILASWLSSPVLPDGVIDQGDRQHIAWTYSGILAGGAPPPPVPGPITIRMAATWPFTQGGAAIMSTGKFIASGMSMVQPVRVIPMLPAMPERPPIPAVKPEVEDIPIIVSPLIPTSASQPPLVTIYRWSIPLCSQWLWDRWLWGRKQPSIIKKWAVRLWHRVYIRRK
jgi:hypothetical protein